MLCNFIARVANSLTIWLCTIVSTNSVSYLKIAYKMTNVKYSNVIFIT
jgi:hypothetical protein